MSTLLHVVYSAFNEVVFLRSFLKYVLQNAKFSHVDNFLVLTDIFDIQMDELNEILVLKLLVAFRFTVLVCSWI
jgi:hypothetical protein